MFSGYCIPGNPGRLPCDSQGSDAEAGCAVERIGTGKTFGEVVGPVSVGIDIRLKRLGGVTYFPDGIEPGGRRLKRKHEQYHYASQACLYTQLSSPEVRLSSYEIGSEETGTYRVCGQLQLYPARLGCNCRVCIHGTLMLNVAGWDHMPAELPE